MMNPLSQLFSRRQMLESSAVAAGLVAAISTKIAAAAPAPAVELSKQATILFQGDSITDARRDRASQDKPNQPAALGDGYPALVAAELLRDYASLDLQIFNRGISGHKVPDLQNRWAKDTVDLQPQVLSILIGVNDIWHKINGKFNGTVESYRGGFSELLKQTRNDLPSVTLVICEPFVLRCGAINDSWFPEFDQRRQAAADVAKEAGALFVPFQSMFDEAVAAGTAPQYWAADGVHPTLAGHSLMAQTWRKVVGI